MQILTEQRIAQLAIWHIVQYSVSSYFKIFHYFEENIAQAIQANAKSIWQQLKLHANHLSRFDEFLTTDGKTNFQQLLIEVEKYTDHILFHNSVEFPKKLLPLPDSPPILFIRGDIACLNQAQIAMVGSRDISPHGERIAFEFAQQLSQQNFIITSGLAAGIDTAAHRGAITQGKTVAVIATGLDQCYPKENLPLWQQILETNGCIVSEFFPNTPPVRRNFPRRNRIISGLAEGVLVVEAGLNSGSLITAQWAAEQGKQVFAIPGHIYSQHHQGCHQLIREGATLVDNPSQIIEDLQMFDANKTETQNIAKRKIQTTTTENITSNTVLAQSENKEIATTQAIDIPEYLQEIYQLLDWSKGISIDDIALHIDKDISELNIAMVELELLGLCTQQAGRYIRSKG